VVTLAGSWEVLKAVIRVIFEVSEVAPIISAVIRLPTVETLSYKQVSTLLLNSLGHVLGVAHQLMSNWIRFPPIHHLAVVLLNH
jgi:hypothetical protein